METASRHICICRIVLVGRRQELPCICLCNVILNFRPEKVKLVCHHWCVDGIIESFFWGKLRGIEGEKGQVVPKKTLFF